jgi:hypothetical protein
MKEETHKEAVIRQLLANSEELLNKHYLAAYELRDQENGITKISFSHEVGYNEFGELIAKSALSSSKRMKFEVEHAVDVTEQPKLDLK